LAKNVGKKAYTPKNQISPKNPIQPRTFTRFFKRLNEYVYRLILPLLGRPTQTYPALGSAKKFLKPDRIQSLKRLPARKLIFGCMQFIELFCFPKPGNQESAETCPILGFSRYYKKDSLHICPH